MKRIVFGVLIIWACLGTAQAQIPVTDGASIANSLASHIATIAEWGKNAASWVKQASDMADQMKAWGQQYNQMKQQYDAITGIRNLGDIFNNPALRRDVPDDWNSVYDTAGDAMKLGDEAGRISEMRGISAKIHAAERLTDSMDNDLARVATRASDMTATNKALGQAAYLKQPGLLKQIESLMGKINETTDAKAIAELQARINAEQAAQTLESNNLLLMVQLQDSERDLAREQRLELSRKILNSKNSTMAGFD